MNCSSLEGSSEYDNAVLQVKKLETAFHSEAGIFKVVDDVSFNIMQGKTLGIVGESGCGKSVTALSIMRLLPKPAGVILGGEILYRGKDILRITTEDMRSIRGRHISMIFQEPMTALNPVHRIGDQIAEVFQLHAPWINEREVHKRSIELLDKVGIPDPRRRMEEYSHLISGGMRQRVMIAMSLAVQPAILIADEPTTALDVTIQAQILDLMKTLQDENGMAMMFITHDLGVIADISDDVVVIYAGTVVESASVRELFGNPAHPYTQGLLESIPRLETPRKTHLSAISGMVPSPGELMTGCRFRNRCHMAETMCEKIAPPLISVRNNHMVRCHLVTSLT